MKMRTEQGMPGGTDSRSRESRFNPTWMLIALLVTLVSMAVGCGGAKQSPPAEQNAMDGAAADATSPIALSWSPQDSCVNFTPLNSTIHLGDRVNFTSSVGETVWVTVAAGLFSANDTTFVVTRGGNQTSPIARAVGTYGLSSSPTACASDELGGGPSIVVGSGEN